MKIKSASSPKDLVILTPAEGENISLHTEFQKRFMRGEYIEPIPPDYWDEKSQEADWSHPLPVTVRWSNPFGKECVLLLSMDEDFSHSERFRALRSKKIYNLIPGRKYFLKVCCGKASSQVISFETQNLLPRLIHIPRVTNIRDLGGWKCAGNKVVRFSMVYRGAQFEKWGTVKGMTAEGKRTFFKSLKLNSILDLRGAAQGKKDLAKNVKKYENYPIQAYSHWHEPQDPPAGIFCEKQMKAVKSIFHLFSQKNSYPLYFHCMGGGDRTGTIAFLLESMLGMEQSVIEKEYEVSNLSTSGIRLRTTNDWIAFMAKLDEFAPGGTIQEKVCAYLDKCGVTEQTREKIRSILLEDAQ